MEQIAAYDLRHAHTSAVRQKVEPVATSIGCNRILQHFYHST